MEKENEEIVYTKIFECYKLKTNKDLRSRVERLLKRNHFDQALGLYQELVKGYKYLLNLEPEELVVSERERLAQTEIDRRVFHFKNDEINLIFGALSHYSGPSNGKEHANLHLSINYLKLGDLDHDLPEWVNHFTSETLVFGCRSNHPVYHQDSGQEGSLVDRL